MGLSPWLLELVPWSREWWHTTVTQHTGGRDRWQCQGLNPSWSLCQERQQNSSHTLVRHDPLPQILPFSNNKCQGGPKDFKNETHSPKGSCSIPFHLPGRENSGFQHCLTPPSDKLAFSPLHSVLLPEMRLPPRTEVTGCLGDLSVSPIFLLGLYLPTYQKH